MCSAIKWFCLFAFSQFGIFASFFFPQWKNPETLTLAGHKEFSCPGIILAFIYNLLRYTNFRPLFLAMKCKSAHTGQKKMYCLRIVFALCFTAKFARFEHKFHFKRSITTLHYNGNGNAGQFMDGIWVVCHIFCPRSRSYILKNGKFVFNNSLSGPRW